MMNLTKKQWARSKMDSEYFVSINNVSRELGIPAYTLRYWEKQFPTVVHPTTGAGGRRYYRGEMIERLRTIQDLLYNRGMTVAGVKKMIHNGDFLTLQQPRSMITPQQTKQFEQQKKAEPVSTEIDDIESVFVAGTYRPGNSIDTTKIDLAIGLLAQARELLE